MEVLIFLTCLVFVANAASILVSDLEEWQAFKRKHNKNYSNETEDEIRMKIFLENKEKIEKHNSRYQNGEVSYEMGVNLFADMFPEELNRMVNGFDETANSLEEEIGGSVFIPPDNVELPDAINWNKKGAVTKVQNQGTCKSSWAFSATGALEGQHFIRKGKLVKLSEQNLVDCSHKQGNNGCRGGSMIKAFNYIKNNSGIDASASYPYEEEEGHCRFNASNVAATDNGFATIKKGDEFALKAAVATIGPISAAIDFSGNGFLFYKSGIYKDEYCSSTKVNHSVLIVGYGIDKATGDDYWLVKNCWGSCWGYHGYIKMARNRANMCGIATKASYPTM